MPKIDHKAALTAALAAPAPVTLRSGCGRVYVMIDKAHRRGIAAAALALGVRYLKEAYGAGKGALYVGYDNANGVELARGAAMVEVLKAHGIPCYRDEVGD